MRGVFFARRRAAPPPPRATRTLDAVGIWSPGQTLALAVAIGLLAAAPQAARAQEALGADVGENMASGNAPLDFRSRVRIRTGYLELDNRVSAVPTRLSATYAPDPRVALRLQIPFPYRDPDAPGRPSAFGVGDISTRLLRLWNHPRVAGFAGGEVF